MNKEQIYRGSSGKPRGGQDVTSDRHMESGRDYNGLLLSVVR